MNMRPIATLALLLTTACTAEPPPPPGRSVAPIYYGTRTPENISLTEGQILAIGWLHTADWSGGNFCTGTLIAPRAVITAAHCFEGGETAGDVGFGVGLYPESPVASFDVAALHIHPSVDAALMILAEDATARVPRLSPIPFNRADPSPQIGERLDAAGYGDTHDDSEGRYFAGVYLEQVNRTSCIVNGRGVQGICFGDSGGPLLSHGPVVVAVESHGDASCVDVDEMTRLDAIASWIDPLLGEDPVDPCDGLDYLGRCDGTVAEWCEEGQLRQHDCAEDGLSCGYVDDEVGYWCTDGSTDPCESLDYIGRCNGTVAEWCEEGEFRQHDCAEDGLGCGYVDDETGYWCTEEGADGDGDVDADSDGDGDGDSDADDDGSRGGCRCQATGAGSTGLPWGVAVAALLVIRRSLR